MSATHAPHSPSARQACLQDGAEAAEQSHCLFFYPPSLSIGTRELTNIQPSIGVKCLLVHQFHVGKRQVALFGECQPFLRNDLASGCVISYPQ